MCTPEMSTQAQVIPVGGEIFAWKESDKTVLLWENKEHLIPPDYFESNNVFVLSNSGLSQHFKLDQGNSDLTTEFSDVPVEALA